MIAPAVPTNEELDDLEHWLRAQYKRHGEVEDEDAANTLAALREHVATCKICRAINMAADDMPDEIRKLRAALAHEQSCMDAWMQKLRSAEAALAECERQRQELRQAMMKFQQGIWTEQQLLQFYFEFSAAQGGGEGK